MNYDAPMGGPVQAMTADGMGQFSDMDRRRLAEMLMASGTGGQPAMIGTPQQTQQPQQQGLPMGGLMQILQGQGMGGGLMGMMGNKGR